MGFTLSCQPDIAELIGKEAQLSGTSRTQYINRVLKELFSVRSTLTEGTRLEELQAYSRLFSDELMLKIPDLADRERRNPDQMLLFLIELGIKAIEERSGSTWQSHENKTVRMRSLY